MSWDPTAYATYRDERSRPFFDLTARIKATAPGVVVDLGCGSGELTVTLAERWPHAVVRGLDSSPEMIERAPADSRVQFELAHGEEFNASGVDVVVSNAALQWMPWHRELLVHWSGQLNPGGTIAFQVPANFEAPSHALMRELADSQEWAEKLTGVLRGTDSVDTPAGYLALFAERGFEVEVWQTQYCHVLQGPDPVLQWVRGTGLRPVLDVLSEADAAAFTETYAAALREAYPPLSFGTVFPFLRTFVVAGKPREPQQPSES